MKKKILLGLALLVLAGCASEEVKQKIQDGNNYKLSKIIERGEQNRKLLPQKSIDMISLNFNMTFPEPYYDKSSLWSEAASICRQKNKFYFYFPYTTQYEKDSGRSVPKGDYFVIYCSKNELTTDPVYGRDGIKRYGERLIQEGPNDLRSTNYSSASADFFNSSNEKIKEEKQKSISQIKATCKEFGFKEGTEKYADCIKDIYLK